MNPAVMHGIVSFGCFKSFLDPTVPALFLGTRVQQLSLELQSLFPPGCVDLTHPMSRYVTHLDILDDSGVEKLLLDIRLLPALTHFSLDSDTPQESALRVLEECPRLELLFVHWFDELLYKASQTPHAYDIRFLMGLCDDYWNDWELGVRGGADFWARADDFVRRKRRGEIDDTRYWLD